MPPRTDSVADPQHDKETDTTYKHHIFAPTVLSDLPQPLNGGKGR